MGNNKIINQLLNELDQIKSPKTYEEIEKEIDYICSFCKEKNNQGRYITSIKNEFLRLCKGILINDNSSDLISKRIKKKRIIKFVLETEINDLEHVQRIYNLLGYPFPYNDQRLSDIYDQTLKLFIEEDLYNGYLESTSMSMPIESIENEIEEREKEFWLNRKDKIVSQSNHEKYKICFYYFLDSYNKKFGIKNKFYKIIEMLYQKIHFDEEIESQIFEESDYYDDIENIFELKVYGIDENKKITINFDKFRLAILLGLLDYILNNNKGKHKFTRINEMKKDSYISEAFLDTINYDDDFSHDKLRKEYSLLFIIDNREEKNEIFINYFTDCLYNLQNILECLHDLTYEQLKNNVILYKKCLDLDAE